ncbi:hypothetical protein [Nostoc sp. CHAB 5715]|uniref:hypothetical protein n=1 Tax=Nostoc sp. CHAB 5715 TaxID=2780400 RepID=UPI001E3A568D|nr:hypothetical protein [Nostoc sp. CHAB 5715]MCC5619810.1 hypothetical protein [Nostoc sp. CHAB 5715]
MQGDALALLPDALALLPNALALLPNALALLPDALALLPDALALLPDALALQADALALQADALVNKIPTQGNLTLQALVLAQYRSVKPKNLGRDAKFRVSTGLKSVPKILN